MMQPQPQPQPQTGSNTNPSTPQPTAQTAAQTIQLLSQQPQQQQQQQPINPYPYYSTMQPPMQPSWSQPTNYPYQQQLVKPPTVGGMQQPGLYAPVRPVPTTSPGLMQQPPHPLSIGVGGPSSVDSLTHQMQALREQNSLLTAKLQQHNFVRPTGAPSGMMQPGMYPNMYSTDPMRMNMGLTQPASGLGPTQPNLYGPPGGYPLYGGMATMQPSYYDPNQQQTQQMMQPSPYTNDPMALMALAGGVGGPTMPMMPPQMQQQQQQQQQQMQQQQSQQQQQQPVTQTFSPFVSRVTCACSNCKKAKTRCDDCRPCGRCRRLGRENTCVDSVHQRRGRAINGQIVRKRPHPGSPSEGEEEGEDMNDGEDGESEGVDKAGADEASSEIPPTSPISVKVEKSSDTKMTDAPTNTSPSQSNISTSEFGSSHSSLPLSSSNSSLSLLSSSSTPSSSANATPQYNGAISMASNFQVSTTRPSGEVLSGHNSTQLTPTLGSMSTDALTQSAPQAVRSLGRHMSPILTTSRLPYNGNPHKRVATEDFSGNPAVSGQVGSGSATEMSNSSYDRAMQAQLMLTQISQHPAGTTVQHHSPPFHQMTPQHQLLQQQLQQQQQLHHLQHPSHATKLNTSLGGSASAPFAPREQGGSMPPSMMPMMLDQCLPRPIQSSSAGSSVGSSSPLPHTINKPMTSAFKPVSSNGSTPSTGSGSVSGTQSPNPMHVITPPPQP